MKKLFILAAIALFLGVATASATNITIFDKNYSAQSVWYGQQEDNEVEPGMATGQEWDLEGFFLNGTKLTLVGGYNFKQGQGGYDSGDIFIDVTGDALFGDIHGGASDENRTVDNTFRYEYVLDLDWKTDGFFYDVYSINESAMVSTAYYQQNQGSSPWRYVSNGTLLLKKVAGTYTPNVTGYLFSGELHNELIVDLGFLPAGSTFLAHFTMGCGNDNIMGSGTIPNPEPGTMLLLGFGLIGIAGFLRRKQ